MQVHYDEGIAIHIGPEPCVAARKGSDEASVRERIGQPLSREKSLILGADAVHKAQGNMSGRDSARPGRPGVVRDPGMCRRSLHGNREISRSTARQQPSVRIGKARSRSR